MQLDHMLSIALCPYCHLYRKLHQGMAAHQILVRIDACFNTGNREGKLAFRAASRMCRGGGIFTSMLSRPSYTKSIRRLPTCNIVNL